MAEPMILNSQSKTLIRNTASLSTEDVVNKLRVKIILTVQLHNQHIHPLILFCDCHQVSITSLKAAHMSEDGSKVINTRSILPLVHIGTSLFPSAWLALILLCQF